MVRYKTVICLFRLDF